MGLGTEELIAFLLTATALSAVPGPDMTYMVTATLRGGLRVGLAAFGAVVVGCLLHVTFAAIGVTALLATLPYVFTALQYIGATYLLYIAWKMAFAEDSSEANTAPKDVKRNTALRAARTALLINLTNPKLGLFFIAFLPQFIDPSSQSPIRQTFILGFVFIAIGNVFNLGSVLITAWTAQQVKISSATENWVKKAAALILCGFAIKIGFGDI